MTVFSRAHGRFVLERLLAPRSLVVLGDTSAAGRVVLENIRAGGFPGPVLRVGLDADAPTIAQLPRAPDLAILACDAAPAGDLMLQLAARGTYAAIAVTQIPGLAGLARAAGMRVLGPNSFGLAVPRLGLNASLAHIAPQPGRMALLTQSVGLARAVLDWAGPNGVGFSHVIGIGGSADLGFALALDWLSRDPDTSLILLDVRRVRDRRAFISAARAASRLRPVVAIRPGGRLLDASGEADEVFAAALQRAGVFTVRNLEAFYAAAETLTRSKPARGEKLAIVTNAIGPGRLAADAALEAGIELAVLPEDAQAALSATLPAEMVQGLVHTGRDGVPRSAEIAAMLSAVPEVGGVLVLLAPTGAHDAAAVQAVIAAAGASKLPVLTCVMGETTGAVHRQRLAEAGLPAFATPEQAVRAFSHLLADRQARLAARELPGRRVLEVMPDHLAVEAILADARAAGDRVLTDDDSTALLGAYGIITGAQPGGAQGLRLRVHDDPMFGPAMAMARPDSRATWDMPPLNLSLAQAMAARAGLPAELQPATARLLVRVSQMVVDAPDLGEILLDGVSVTAAGAMVGNARVGLREGADRAQLAISPYPEQLIESWESKGQHFVIRPIRPEDAEAHAAMTRRCPPEDLRYRFFSAMRELSTEQMVRLTQIDYDREMAFIAVRQPDQATTGVARLVRGVDTASGEFAIVVEPSVKGLGLARHLMDRLISWARDVGITEITGTVLADNHPMLGFVRHLGFVLHRVVDEPELVEAVLEI